MRNVDDDVKIGPAPIIPEEANYNPDFKDLLRLKDEGETYLWYQRFLIYLRFPPICRTVSNAWLAEKKLKIGEDLIKPEDRLKPRYPATWYKAHGKWRWQERAELYDNFRNSVALKHEDELHQELIRTRRLAEMQAMEKIRERIGSIDSEELTATQALRALSTLTATVRKDFHEDAKKKDTTLDDLLKALPPAIVEQLMASVQARGGGEQKKLNKPGTVDAEWEEVK